MNMTTNVDAWTPHPVASAVASTLLFALVGSASSTQAQDVDAPTPSLEVSVEEEEDVGGAPSGITLELAYAGVLFPITERVRAQVLLAYNSGFDLLLGVGDLSVDVHENMDLGVSYVLLARLDGAEEHTLRFYQNLVFENGPFKFDVRNAIDYRVETDEVDERTRYRARIRSTYAGQLSGIRYSVYASVEPIFNLNEARVTQVSFAVGGYIHLFSHVWLNAFYQRTETKTGPDIDFPGAGLLGIF